MTKILVVDDEANVQRLLQYTLKQAGYTVSVAGDGQEALKLWSSESPGLILLDVSLPKLDGYAVAERIRAQEGGKSHVPIIMLTAEREVEQKVRGLRAGADDYLVKPFHQAELLARMRGLLSRFGPQEGVGSRARPALGKMIAFYGAKGGVGATTIAINTAIALHTELDRKVALVDGVLQFGDHRVFLDLGNDRKSVTDLMNAPQVDADLLKGVLVKHDSGVDLLLAPTSPEEADLVNPDNLASILAMLRTMYDYVIVDVDKRLGDLVLSILDHSGRGPHRHDRGPVVPEERAAGARGAAQGRLRLQAAQARAQPFERVHGHQRRRGRERPEARVRDEDHERVPGRDQRPEHGLAIRLLQAGCAVEPGDHRARADDRFRVCPAGDRRRRRSRPADGDARSR